MILAEVRNPTNIRLTCSDTDGIFLHFDTGEQQAGIRLDNPKLPASSVATIWAKQQLAEKLHCADMERRLKAHIKGESCKGFCKKCTKPAWFVDDEDMTCPHCGHEDFPVPDITDSII